MYSFFGSSGKSVGGHQSSSTHASKSTRGHAELLEKFDKLFKFVTEKDTSVEAINGTRNLNPHDTDKSAKLIGADVTRQNSASVEDNARHSSSMHFIYSSGLC